jgi:DNA-binding NarL/FixJ family response regulator
MAGMRPLCVIVDDNEPFLQVARSMLDQQGMVVVGVATTGAEAVRQTRELHPDVALVDISLGTESGFGVARLLVDHVEHVIMISSHEEDDYADLITESPAVGFLSKTDLSAAAILRLLNTAAGQR